MTERQQTAEERFAVASRKATLVAGYALAAVAVWAFMTGHTAWGIALVVLIFVLVVLRAGWTFVRGRRKLAERAKAEIPDAPVSAHAGPVPVDQVVNDLLGMNSDGLPYLIEAERSGDSVQVDVRWKSEEMRWQTLFVKGSVSYAWRMEVTLDPSSGKYKFVEYSGKSTTRAAISPGGAYVRGNWTWTRGKSAGQVNMAVAEGADGQVHVSGPQGPRTSWEGVVQIKPADAKVPVFTVLRNNGWRPRFDWAGARMFEK
jgi:hypothetical protein